MRVEFGFSMLWPNRKMIELLKEEFNSARHSRKASRLVSIFTYLLGLAIVGGYALINLSSKGLTTQIYTGAFMGLLNLMGLLAHLKQFNKPPERYWFFFPLFGVQLINVWNVGLAAFMVLPLLFGQVYVLTNTRQGFWTCFPLLAAAVFTLLMRNQFSPTELESRAMLAIGFGTAAIHLCSGFCTTLLAQLINSRQRAEDLEQRRQYVSLATHELRTPLAHARQSLYNSPLAGLDLKLFNTLDHELEHLNWIVSRVVDFQAYKDHQLQPQFKPIQMSNWVKELEHDMALAASRRSVLTSVEMHEDVPEWLLVDSHLLKKALRCLIENAIEHNSKQGYVKVSLMALDGQQLAIEISDSAGGLNKRHLKRLFQAYESPDLTDSSHWRGFGLGLYMARAYTHSLGGQLELLKTSLSGSVFRITLPLSTTVAPNEQSGTVHTPSSNPVNMQPLAMVVDDSLPILESTAELLERLGFDTHRANSGESALTQSQDLLDNNRQLDLVLMDLQMPGMDGFETARRLRELFGVQRPRILAFTASTHSELSEAYNPTCFDGFYQKGDSVQKLISLIEQSLQPAPTPINYTVTRQTLGH